MQSQEMTGKLTSGFLPRFDKSPNPQFGECRKVSLIRSPQSIEILRPRFTIWRGGLYMRKAELLEQRGKEDSSNPTIKILEGMNPLKRQSAQASFKLKWTCVRATELTTTPFRLLFQETLETSHAYRLPLKGHGLDHMLEDRLAVKGRHLLRRVVLFPPGT